MLARFIIIAVGLAALLAAGLPDRAPAAPERPNVVVIMTDDQTYADMVAMPRTRRLIGRAGVQFRQSYVSYPLCCPSRATFLTGQYAHNHGVKSTVPPNGGFERLRDEETLAVWLQRAGYTTHHIGKYLNGYGLRRRPSVPPGWDDWQATIDKSTYQMYGYEIFENGARRTYGEFDVEDPAMYQTDVLGEKALNVVRSHAGGDQPFFLNLSFVAPHGEVLSPGSLTDPYIRPAARHEGRFAGLQLPRRSRGVGAARQDRILFDMQARRESLLAVDEAIGALVAELQATGQLERTYLLFTSDNGFMEGQHGIAKGKYVPYEASARVPLLMRGPGIPPRTVSDEVVGNIDLAPTIVALAGAEPGLEMDGRSLLPYAQDGDLRSRRPLLHEGLVAGDVDRDDTGGDAPDPGPSAGVGGGETRRARIAQQRGTYYAVRTGRWLYVRWQGGARELYDLRRDPHERRTLHRDRRFDDVEARLGAEIRRLKACAGASCRQPAGSLKR